MLAFADGIFLACLDGFPDNILQKFSNSKSIFI